MKIAIITLEPIPFNRNILGMGCGLRAYNIGKILEEFCEVKYIFPYDKKIENDNYITYDRHINYIDDLIPEVDLVIAIGWVVLNKLKSRLDVPLVLDLFGTFVMEHAYFPEFDSLDVISAKINALRKADHFFFLSKRQKAYFLPWLMFAGFDVKNENLLTHLPLFFINTRKIPFNRNKDINFIFTGYLWPHQETLAFLEKLVSFLKDDKLILFTGIHPYCRDILSIKKINFLKKKKNVIVHSPVPFYELENSIPDNSIGIDLSLPNNERFLATPVKISYYLSKNMPVIVSSHYEISLLINKKMGIAVDYDNFEKSFKVFYRNIKDNFERYINNIKVYNKLTMNRIKAVLNRDFLKKLLKNEPLQSPYLKIIDEYIDLKNQRNELYKIVEKQSLKKQIALLINKIIGR